MTPLPDTPAPERIQTDNLVKVFGQRSVVNGVSIHVDAGEVVGLLGPNGAGKTTCFYMIVGLVKPTSGQVWMGGQPVTHLPMHRRARAGMGYLPQEASIFRKLTVYQNIEAIVETLPVPAKKRRETVFAHLSELGIEELAHQKAYTLSGGERRRLEIARALVTHPRFLLLDEPFSGVDPISVADVQDIVASLAQKGIGILITDHNVRETLAITRRAYIIHEGKVLCEGPSQELVNDPVAREFYLGGRFAL